MIGMTKTEYAAYEKSVADFLTRENCKAGCNSPCMTEDGDHQAFFSWRPCECCGSPLGGDREEYEFARNDAEPNFTAKICMDCVYYLVYGKLGDTTMMEIEAS